MKFELFNKRIIKLLGLSLVIFLVAILLGQSGFGEKQPPAPTPTIAPTPQPSPITYAEGLVAIWFKEEVTYGEARELLTRLGLKIEDTNPLWKMAAFQPTDATVLEKPNFFEVSVPAGKEDEVINQLMENPIVRVAAKKVVTR